MIRRNRIKPGAVVDPRELETIHGRRVPVPDPHQFVHLQFRRFAGCPVCDLHLHALLRRRKEIAAASIREVVVFHSAPELLLPHAGDLPFDVIADPARQLYRAFAVESAPRALFDPRVWLPILRGVARSLARVLRGQQPLPPLNPAGGRYGLPAEFLIAPDGRVLASKYGAHAYDQWSVDELLARASTRRGAAAETARSAPARPPAAPAS
jgi:AhpC/TSA family